MDLESKICIVTGAARGIGEAIARRFVAPGAKVVIADLILDAPVNDGVQMIADKCGGARPARQRHLPRFRQNPAG